MINTKSVSTKAGKSHTKKIITGQAWRLVYDETAALAVIEGTAQSKTETIHKVIECKTYQECLNEIVKLGLTYKTEEEI